MKRRGLGLPPAVDDLLDELGQAHRHALEPLAPLLRRGQGGAPVGLIGESIEFRVVHERDFWLVKVDQGPFEQVLINLAVNARDAMTGGGREKPRWPYWAGAALVVAGVIAAL